MSTDHNFWKERRAKADLNRGPSAYQPNLALPFGQTGSLLGIINLSLFILSGGSRSGSISVSNGIMTTSQSRLINWLPSLVQFSSRWYLCSPKSPYYAFQPVPQKFPHRCPWNGSKVRLTDDGPLSSFQGRLANQRSVLTTSPRFRTTDLTAM